MVMETFPIDESAALNEWLCQQYGVLEEKRLTTPMIFVGDDVLIGHEADCSHLTFAVARYAAPGARGASLTDSKPREAWSSASSRSGCSPGWCLWGWRCG
jgi:hypothetical protein